MASMNLLDYFFSNTQRPIHKNIHYFPIYERHFAPFVARPLVLFEIGCGRGGSLQMWKRFFGPNALIVGIDINPNCAEFEDEQVKICIGSQSDTVFMQDVLDRFGRPDIVIDDGSHIMDDVNATFSWLYPRMSKHGIYLVEDLHTAYWTEFGGGFRKPGTFIERCKDLIDELNADYTRGYLPETEFSVETISMHFYDSVVVFERGATYDKRSVVTGDQKA